MSYTRVNWTGATPIDPTNLNLMDQGIERTHAIALTTTQRDALSGGDLFTGRIIFNTTTGRAQVYNGTSWLEQSGGGLAPVNVTKAAAAEGTSLLLAKADHKHDVTTGAPSNIGTANAEGSGTNLARRTHVHDGRHAVGGAVHNADTLANFSAKISDGTVILASQAEAEAGTENTKRMTPLRVAQAITAQGGGEKARCTVASDGTLQSNSLNITSVVRDNTGDYTVTFNVDFANANYACIVSPELGSNLPMAIVGGSPAVGSVAVKLTDQDGFDQDTPFHLAAFGDQ